MLKAETEGKLIFPDTLMHPFDAVFFFVNLGFLNLRFTADG
ncbi:hypothetical protein SSYM_1576 [Serratia symbiotica str. Tucson]|uniref:Uncharacterized protein n=1 Tax=Serratia symbiotica str. Tucson TaxID=914128 RepID=E9CMM0_9GAMM|nr:hypothetical protein SSYM_1576 [Serratia symbiotica str. Tucson]